MKLFYCCLLLFITNGLHAQLIIDIANTRGETEYDRVIDNINKDSALYRINKVKKAGFQESDCKCDSYFFINKAGLIHKIESGSRKVDIQYKNGAIAAINIIESIYNWYSFLHIERKGNQISRIAVTSDKGNYRIDFSTTKKGNVQKKFINMTDSAGKIKSQFVITHTKNDRFEMTEGFHKRNLFKKYYVDGELILDERYELNVSGKSIDTVIQSHTKMVRRKTGEWVHAEVYYRGNSYTGADVRVTLFDTKRLPSKLYIFGTAMKNDLHPNPGIIDHIYNKDGLLMKEIMGNYDKEWNFQTGQEYPYQYEFYE